MRLCQCSNTALDVGVEGNSARTAGIDVQQHLFAGGHRLGAIVSKHLQVKVQPFGIMPKHAHIDANLRAFYAALKPGGILGVEEHRAAPGTSLQQTIDSGYVTEAYVIEHARAAGFELAAQSEVNSNPRDTKNYPNGVWSLPPTYKGHDVDRAKYAAIGESDRMTLRFVKPR